MKRIRKKVIPLFVALLILVGVPLTSYEEVKATGVEEYLYYTYWDLMNSLYAMTGYDMKISESEIKNHGVSGKQAWKNFTTFVENSAKIHWKLYSDAGSSAMKELKNLVNTVTKKGISISQDLYDMLKDVFGYQVKYNKNVCFDNSSVDAVDDFIKSVSGCYNTTLAEDVYEGKCRLYVLSGVRSGKTGRIAFGVWSDTSFPLFITYDKSSGLYSPAYNYNGRLITVGSYGKFCCSDGTVVDDVSVEFWESAPSFIINDGCWAGSDVVSAQVSAGACPKEVPDVSPWIKHTDVPDEWRIVKPDEVPDPNDDNDGDALPVVIPIHPAKPDKPSETETEESTEKPDKDKSKDPSVIINPSTGNQIDPNTGLDIDPDTGYLIDPDTGDLIDPNTGKKVDKNKIKNRVKNLPSIASGAGNITKYFPFCIPWDMIALIKSMNASKKAPVFHFEHYFEAINYNFVIDVNLEDYWKYIKIFRWGMTIFFVIGLFFVTVKFTTFVYRMGG